MSHTLSTDALAASTHLLHRHARCIDILTASQHRQTKHQYNCSSDTNWGCAHSRGGADTSNSVQLRNWGACAELGGCRHPQFCPVAKLTRGTPGDPVLPVHNIDCSTRTFLVASSTTYSCSPGCGTLPNLDALIRKSASSSTRRFRRPWPVKSGLDHEAADIMSSPWHNL